MPTQPQIVNNSWMQTIAQLLSGDTVDNPINGSWLQTIAYLIANQNLDGDYLPLSGGTVTGDTIFTQGLTANTISSPSLYWINGDVNSLPGTITNKESGAGGAFNTNVIMHHKMSTSSNNNNSVMFAGNLADIRRSDDSGLFASRQSQLFRANRSVLIASNSSVIGDLNRTTGDNNFIIGSTGCLLRNLGPNNAATLFQSSIISSDNCNVLRASSAGPISRVVVIGMKDYTTDKQGVHVENLYITSGATEDYVWTAVDSTGRGEWRASSGGSGIGNLDGGTPGDVLVFSNIDGGTP
jgi:hypothetical protein